jgi:hypothetical protein
MSVDPRRSLALLKPELELLTERIARLLPEELDRPSNLAPWSVADVGVHIMRVYDSIDLAGRSLPAPHSDARNRGRELE